MHACMMNAYVSERMSVRACELVHTCVCTCRFAMLIWTYHSTCSYQFHAYIHTCANTRCLLYIYALIRSVSCTSAGLLDACSCSILPSASPFVKFDRISLVIFGAMPFLWLDGYAYRTTRRHTELNITHLLSRGTPSLTP